MNIHKSLPQIVSVLIALGVLLYIIAVPIGVADGGGQYKVLEGFGLNYISAPSAEYFAVQYGIFGETHINDTHSFFTALAKTINKDILDVRSLALIYGILFILGLWLAVRSGIREDKLNWALALISVFIFADIGYTAYFNTLYVEAVILVTFILSVSFIFLCHKKKAPIHLVLLSTVSSLAFAFCGTLQAFVGVVLGLIIMRFYVISSKKINGYLSIASGLAVIISSILFASSYKPADYEKNIFHSVFLGTAKYESVEKLGLNPKLDELEGQFYSEDLVEEYNLRTEFFNKINYGKITKFYASNIGAYIKEFNGAVRNAYTMRPSYLGNYTQASGHENELAGGFSLYSNLKGMFVPNTFAFTFIFFLTYLGVLIYLYISEKEKRPVIEVLIGIRIAVSLCLKIPVILTGGYEIGRALFTFNIMFDTMILLAIVAGGRYMIQRRKNLQQKFGASQ